MTVRALLLGAVAEDVVFWLDGDIPLYPHNMRVIKDGGDDSTRPEDNNKEAGR